MRAISKSIVLLTVAVGLCAGCEEESKPKTSETTTKVAKEPAPTPSASVAQRKPRRPGRCGARGGPAGILLAAANDLTLDDAQRSKVDAVGEKIGSAAGGGKEMREYQAVVMEGIKAGKIDTTKLEPLYETMERARAEQKAKQAEALDGLYAALTPEQRKSVADKLKPRFAERAEPAPDQQKKKADPKERAQHKLDRMTKDLSLTDAQKKKLEPLLVKEATPAEPQMNSRAASKKRMTALLEAFEKDGFDAKKLDLSAGPDPKEWKKRMDSRVSLFNQISAVLEPEQRDKLAASMRRGRGGRLQNPHRQGPNMRAMPMMPGGPMARRARQEVMSDDSTWMGPTIELPYDDGEPASE